MKRMIRLNQIFRSRKIVPGTVLNVPVFVGGVVGDFPIFFSTSNTKWGRAWIFLPLFLRVQPGPLLFQPGSYSQNVGRFTISGIVPLFLCSGPPDEMQKHPVQVLRHDRNNSLQANLAIEKPRKG